MYREATVRALHAVGRAALAPRPPLLTDGTDVRPAGFGGFRSEDVAYGAMGGPGLCRKTPTHFGADVSNRLTFHSGCRIMGVLKYLRV